MMMVFVLIVISEGGEREQRDDQQKARYAFHEGLHE
jgi:hypothetical protein